MAVTSGLTSIENFEGSPTFSNYGGGSGASTNTDIFIEGAQSAGRRADNVTDGGFGATFTAVDLSAAGQHVKIWLFVTQWASVTAVKARIGSGSNDDHTLPTVEYPPLGGFIPVWVDVSRAPEAGGSANEASINEIGILLTIGNVGGNAQNLILDEIMYGTDGLTWDGTGGAISDFVTFEDTNNEGNLVASNGVNFVYSRLTVGSATATTFDDSGFTLIYPDQALVASNFMGFTADLQNASTDISINNATIQSGDPSGATNRPDLIVTGTSGVMSIDAVNLLGLRAVDLTSAVTFTNNVINNTGVITANGATLSNCSIADQTGAVTVANLNQVDDCAFTHSSTTPGHAVDLGTVSTTTSMNWNCTLSSATAGDWTGSAGTNVGGTSTDAAITVNVAASQTLTINVASGATIPTVRNTGTGQVDVVAGQTTITITAFDGTGTPAVVTDQSIRVYLVADANDASAGITSGDVLINALTDTSGQVSYTAGLSAALPVSGWARRATSSFGALPSGTTFFEQGLINASMSNSADTNVNVILQPDE